MTSLRGRRTTETEWQVETEEMVAAFQSVCIQPVQVWNNSKRPTAGDGRRASDTERVLPATSEIV
jgi:hypothetical protein